MKSEQLTDCCGLGALLEREQILNTRCFEPRPPKQKIVSEEKPRFIVQISADALLPRWVEAGLDQGLLRVERVSALAIEVNQLVLAQLYSNEEILGTVQVIFGTSGPHDRIRLVSQSRVFNLNRPQILGIVREAA